MRPKLVWAAALDAVALVVPCAGIAQQPSEQDRLFYEFMQWKRAKGRR